jgi:hypothetical protein
MTTIGIRALALFFLFGFAMCALTIVMLSFPGGALEPLWRINPDARIAFRSIGPWAFALMAVVGTLCLMSAIGLYRGMEWGRRLAIVVLSANLIGDLAGAVVRRDARTLVGLPVAVAMIWFLRSRRVRELFAGSEPGDAEDG